MTPAERLNEVLRVTRTNVKSLSERLGYARPQGLYDIVAGRTKSLSADLCRKIITAFPEFNHVWLLTGEGEMLVQDKHQKENLTNDNCVLSGDAMKIFLNMSNTISRQEENISKLTDMVNRLTCEQVAPKKGKVG